MLGDRDWSAYTLLGVRYAYNPLALVYGSR